MRTKPKPDRHLSLAAVAITPDLAPDTSCQRIAESISQVKAVHPDVRLILFGEVILGWFYKKGETEAYHRRIAETIPGPSTEFIASLAEAHDVYVSFGMTEKRNEKLFNTQVLIDPKGAISAVHRKFWIRNRVFTPGERRLTIAEIDGAKVATLICADGRSLWLLCAIRRARPDIVLASLADYGTSLRLNQMMGTFYDAWTVAANRYGEEPPLTWHGLITITDPLARMRAHGMGKEQFLHCRIPLVCSGPVRRTARRIFVGGKLLVFIFVLLCEMVAKKLRRQ